MTGTVHIFLRHVANGADIYQVNYTTAGSTFAKVFASDSELQEFLSVDAGLTSFEVDAFWQQLTREGTATVEDVEISPQQASAVGMTHAEIDF